MTSDERTTYTVVQGADLVDISDSGVVTMKAVGSGAVEIQVSFPNYMQAQHLAAASVSLTLVQMTGISLTFLPYPGYISGFTADPEKHVKKVDCSGISFFNIIYQYFRSFKYVSFFFRIW